MPPGVPCPLCGRGSFSYMSSVIRHCLVKHPELSDRERSDVAHR